MATINVQLPDGSTQPLNYPDTWNDDQIKNFVRSNMSTIKNGAPVSTPKSQESIGQDIIRYAINDPLASLSQMAAGIAKPIVNAPHDIAALFSPSFASHIPTQPNINYSEAYGIPENQKNMADKVMQFAPQAAASFALPETELGSLGNAISSIPKVGNYLKTALGNALSQGLFAATQAPQDQGKAALAAGGIAGPFSILAQGAINEDPTIRTLSRALLGTGSGVLGYEGAKALGAPAGATQLAGALLGLAGYKGINPRQTAAENVLKGVEGTDYQSALDATNRLGLTYGTPAEMSGNPFTGASQGNIGKTEKGAQLLYQKGEGRVESEKNAINRLLDNVYDPSIHEQQKNNFYNAAQNKIIVDQDHLDDLNDLRGPSPEEIKQDQDLRAQIKQQYTKGGVADKILNTLGIPAKDQGNEIFKDAEKQVLNDPAYREELKGLDSNSIGYLQQIKSKMDEMISKSLANNNLNRARIIGNTQNKLMDMMDEVSPEYAQGRSLAERQKTRDQIESYFNTRKMTGTNMGKFLNNGNRYDDLQNHLDNALGAQSDPDEIAKLSKAKQDLEDMKLIFPRLINVPNAKNAEALSRTSMSKSRSSAQDYLKMLQELLSGGSYDQRAVELATSPNWKEQLTRVNAGTPRDQFMGYLSKLLASGGAQGVGQNVRE